MVTILVTITEHMVDLCPVLTSLKEIQCLRLNQPLPFSFWTSLLLCCEERLMGSPLYSNKSRPSGTQGEVVHFVIRQGETEQLPYEQHLSHPPVFLVSFEALQLVSSVSGLLLIIHSTISHFCTYMSPSLFPVHQHRHRISLPLLYMLVGTCTTLRLRFTDRLLKWSLGSRMNSPPSSTWLPCSSTSLISTALKYSYCTQRKYRIC